MLGLFSTLCMKGLKSNDIELRFMIIYDHLLTDTKFDWKHQ